MAQARPTTAGQAQGQEQSSAQGRQMTTGQQGQQGALARRESAPWTWGDSPFSLVRRFSEDMDRFFGDVFSDFGLGRGWRGQRIGRGDAVRGHFVSDQRVNA